MHRTAVLLAGAHCAHSAAQAACIAMVAVALCAAAALVRQRSLITRAARRALPHPLPMSLRRQM
jgi:hypothetical protein